MFDIVKHIQMRTSRCASSIVCNDGFRMSVQASEFHYCTPRENFGPWTHFEIGYPSHNEPSLEEYSDGDDIYGWVPRKVIDQIIENHDGVNLEKTLDIPDNRPALQKFMEKVFADNLSRIRSREISFDE